MAEKIKGFTIELDLDSMKVSSGLTDVKASMKAMNAEMKANMSSFDRGEKSLSKYQTQVAGLNKKLELQKDATESARKHYEKMVDVHGEGSKEAMDAAASYNYEVAQLNNLQRYTDKVTAEMKEFQHQQQVQSTTTWKMGDALQNFGGKLESVSRQSVELGKKLTKGITVPALGVVAAAGGITAALGWERLVSLDEAQGQLKGLGYSTKEVGDISDTVSKAVAGGMTTMAEGTKVAAGGLAAGVKEGKELERYIKLVGDAAVGANMPVEEMAQIFNRVQGSGKLMTQELNMIEQRLPGFSQAMADEVAGGSMETFRDMVTAGEVGSEEFLDVMDDFAGGMAEAYADTWSGMVANTKAQIGILGETMLGGVFEKSKESLSEFLTLLESESAQQWAEQVGQKIGEVFSSIVDNIRGAVVWFVNLDSKYQKLIGGTAAFVVALGPLLVVLGKIGLGASNLAINIGTLSKRVAEAGGFFKFLSPVIGALTSPVTIVIASIAALATGFVIAYKKSATFREFVQMLGEKLKEIFHGIMEWVQPGLDAVVNFFNKIKEKFTAFWAEDGQQFIQAWQNIWSFVSPILGGIWEVVKWCFDKIKWIIADYVMPLIEFIIKSVWGNIKGIITGALDVIMGAVKIFSGLFTGDFSKMWEGVKQLFSGAIKVIWNWVQLQFFGKLFKGVGGLAKGFWGWIKKMWKWVKETFANSISFVYKKVSNSFIGKTITSIINFVKNFKSNISGMWTSVKKKFTEKIGEIKTSIENSFVGKMIKSVTTLKNDFVKLAGDIWKGVKGKFDDIVAGAKELPGRIGEGISSTKKKATDGMKSVGNKLIEWAGKPFNKVVDGVNWITEKLGVETKLSKWDYPQYAKGTDGHPGGHFIAGEKGKELVSLPNGQSFVTPNKATLYPNMPSGTHVIPNGPTEDILKGAPKYAKGTGLWSGIKDVWEYVKKPSKLVDKVMDKIDISDKLTQIPKKMVSAGFNYLKTKPYEYIKNKFKTADNPYSPSTKSGQAWRGQIKQAAARMNEKATGAQVSGIIAQIARESGGNEKITQSSSVVDVNTLSGNPAKGLLQYIPQTFRAYSMKGHRNILKGYDQLLAFFNNRNWRTDLPYGKSGWGPSGGRKYKRGTNYVPETGPAFLHKGEAIIPKEYNQSPTRAMKLLAVVGRKLENSVESNKPENNKERDDNLEKIVSYLSEQVNDTKEIVSLLAQLLMKNTDIVMNDRVLAEEITPIVSEIQGREKDRLDRFRGRG